MQSVRLEPPAARGGRIASVGVDVFNVGGTTDPDRARGACRLGRPSAQAEYSFWRSNEGHTENLDRLTRAAERSGRRRSPASHRRRPTADHVPGGNSDRPETEPL